MRYQIIKIVWTKRHRNSREFLFTTNCQNFAAHGLSLNAIIISRAFAKLDDVYRYIETDISSTSLFSVQVLHTVLNVIDGKYLCENSSNYMVLRCWTKGNVCLCSVINMVHSNVPASSLLKSWSLFFFVYLPPKSLKATDILLPLLSFY